MQCFYRIVIFLCMGAIAFGCSSRDSQEIIETEQNNTDARAQEAKGPIIAEPKVPLVTRKASSVLCPWTVVIDPGHGGNRTIARSSANNASGKELLEKDLTLEIGRATASALSRRGYSVFLTRSTDTNLGLWARANLAKYLRAAAFVSIHFNGFLDETTQGTETIHHTSASPESIALANAIQKHVLRVTNLADRGVRDTEEVGLNIFVLRPEEHAEGTAAALVEISFLTDPEEEERLKDRAYKAALAEALRIAIEEYLVSLRRKLNAEGANTSIEPAICRKRPNW